MRKRFKPCNQPGCPEITHTDYCKQHAIKHKSIYGTKKWESLSSYKRQMNPLCEICLSKGRLERAALVHHIVEVNVDYSKSFEMSNLQSLCISCHNKIHYKK